MMGIGKKRLHPSYNLFAPSPAKWERAGVRARYFSVHRSTDFF
jgi:hypothetical protein